MRNGVRMKITAEKIKSGAVILVGVILLSVSISSFCVPNKIVSGGVSGIATVIFYLFKIPVGISYYAVNVIFLVLGYKSLGKSFVVKTLVCAGLTSVFSDIFSSLPPITVDPLLAAVFGGVLGGSGIGLTLIENASTGGTDIAARLVQSKIPHLPIGKLLLAVDAVVIAVSFFVFGNVELTLYGILSLAVSSASVDMLINKMNESKLVFVISEKGSEIVEKYVKKSNRGATVIDAFGAFTGNKKSMLVCAIKEYELPGFKKNITQIDKDAFVVFSESQQIIGNGFYVYH